MFDKYMIMETGFCNVFQEQEVIGFQLQARLPYYRGLGLSMVEDIRITVDGNAVPREAIRFTTLGKTYSLEEMETEMVGRWEFGEVATLTINQPGGLSSGQHEIELVEQLRISYLPFPSITKDKKTLAL